MNNLSAEKCGRLTSTRKQSAGCAHKTRTMPGATYTLILTKGTHVISRDGAERILGALRTRQVMIEIELDPFGPPDSVRSTTLLLSHVVALTENPPLSVPATPAENVIALRKKGRA